jgi:hypothetical protein
MRAKMGGRAPEHLGTETRGSHLQVAGGQLCDEAIGSRVLQFYDLVLLGLDRIFRCL